jgi:hypothetical protein
MHSLTPPESTKVKLSCGVFFFVSGFPKQVADHRDLRSGWSHPEAHKDLADKPDLSVETFD